MKGSTCFIIFMSFLLLRVESNPVDLGQSFFFDSLRNVTVGATSLISDSIQESKKIILKTMNTAKDYVTNAVERPIRILNNARDVTAGYIDSAASRGMEIKMKSLMEILRANMKYGVPVLDLPVLEPLRIDHMDFAVDNKDIGNISSSIDNATIFQLSTFDIDHVKLSLVDGVSLALNVSVPTIPANGMYQVSGTMGKMFAVDGKGPFELEVHGAKFYIHTVLGYSKVMYVKSLDIDFSMASLNASFQHLFPDQKVNDMVNKVRSVQGMKLEVENTIFFTAISDDVVSDMAPEILEVIKPDLKPELEEIIAERINATVARLTMGNIIAILTGTVDIRSFAHLITPRLSF